MENFPTRESDFDHEFKVSIFDYVIDQFQAGSLSWLEALEAYHQIMQDRVDNE